MYSTLRLILLPVFSNSFMWVLFNDHYSFLVIGPNNCIQVFGVIFQKEEIIFWIKLAIKDTISERQAVPFVEPKIQLISYCFRKDRFTASNLRMGVSTQKIYYLLGRYSNFVSFTNAFTRKCSHYHIRKLVEQLGEQCKQTDL